MKTFSIFQNTALALGCATLVLTGICARAGDLQPLASASQKNQSVQEENSDGCEGRSLTIKGDFVTAIQVLPPFPSFPPGPFQPILHLLITADGKLSHFGKTTAATTDQAVDLSVNPNQGTGHWLFQNKKGDVLLTEMELTGTPLDAEGGTSFQGTLTVIGGSGKFEGAVGTLQFEGAAQGDAGFFSIAGTIC